MEREKEVAIVSTMNKAQMQAWFELRTQLDRKVGECIEVQAELKAERAANRAESLQRAAQDAERANLWDVMEGQLRMAQGQVNALRYMMSVVAVVAPKLVKFFTDTKGIACAAGSEDEQHPTIGDVSSLMAVIRAHVGA